MSAEREIVDGLTEQLEARPAENAGTREAFDGISEGQARALVENGQGYYLNGPPAPDAQAALHAALAAAQAEMPAVDKDSVNPHFKSKFVSLDHLIALTRPVLNRHGLSIDQFPVKATDGMPALRTTIRHAAGGLITGDMPLLPGKPDMQGLGAAITYGRRFAWASVCGIASETDDDGESIVARPQEPRGAAAAPQANGGEGATATEPEKGSQWEKDQKACHAIKRKLLAAGLGEEQFAANLSRDYGTAHINELTEAQTSALAGQLREAEKAIT